MINENRGVVWFVEKNKETASSEYARGDSFGLHKNLSLYNSYRIGRLGAKPGGQVPWVVFSFSQGFSFFFLLFFYFRPWNVYFKPWNVHFTAWNVYPTPWNKKNPAAKNHISNESAKFMTQEKIIRCQIWKTIYVMSYVTFPVAWLKMPGLFWRFGTRFITLRPTKGVKLWIGRFNSSVTSSAFSTTRSG